MQVMIGTDELILWLRKNSKAVGVENILLGRRIIGLIKTLGGQPKVESQPSLWANDLSDVAMAKLGLPKTSEQYLINVNTLPDIYKELSAW